MLKIKTKIKQSSVHGIGLFADQFIPKGTVTWKFDLGKEKIFKKKKINQMNNIEKNYLLYYCYFDYKRDAFVLPIDHLKFINHAINKKKMNIDSTPDQDIANRDISEGEELLCDYNKFDKNYFKRIGNPKLK